MEYDLVFEGGGAKGIVFVGAMQEFEQRGHTYKRLLGTSAGAITAALLAAGYTAQEMLDALEEKEEERPVFSTFLGKPGPFEREQVLSSATLQFLNEVDIPLIPDFIEHKLDAALVRWLSEDPRLACSYSFLEYGGLYSAERFIEWLRRRLDSGENRGEPRRYSEMSLEEFFEATGYELTLVASDTTAGAMLALNHRTAPDLPVVWAVRMSMSIPFLWQEVLWQTEWGLYRGRDMVGHAIVDGGILSNFPIELFISEDEFVKELMGEESGEAVLGLLIDETLYHGVEAEDEPEKPASPITRAPLIKRITNLVNTTLSAHDKLVSEHFERLVVRLPARGYGTTEFDMTDERRSRLVRAGCETMKAYFDRLPVSFGLEEAAADPQAVRQADRVALRMLSH